MDKQTEEADYIETAFSWGDPKFQTDKQNVQTSLLSLLYLSELSESIKQSIPL